ncbi:MAG: GIDE domain-containing protein [Candidatus Eisenbacteria bacterium]
MFHPGVGFFAAAALLGGPVWFLHGFQSFRRKRLIENTPTARIRSMAMGLVEVTGSVTGRSQLTSPFSGRPCAFWQVDVSSRASKRGWRVVHSNQSGNPFFLRDETGVALVYPQGAECRVQFQLEEECSGIGLPACYGEYLKEHAPAHSTLWRIGGIRFRERILEDGQRAYLLGTAMPRSKAHMVSDAEELVATGTDGMWTVQHRHLDESVVATIRRGTHEPTFIISQSSERELTFMLAAKAFGGMVGGPLAALLGLGYWLVVLAGKGWGK